MRLKKKLTLMKPSELRDYQEIWLKRIKKFKPHKFRWKRCSRRIKLIQEEIVFKDWVLGGLKKMNRDKINE